MLKVLNKLVDKGNTVVIIEHNLDVIKVVDYIVDIGPEGGDKGGNIVCKGTPEQVAKNKDSFTGQFLKTLFYLFYRIYFGAMQRIRLETQHSRFSI